MKATCKDAQNRHLAENNRLFYFFHSVKKIKQTFSFFLPVSSVSSSEPCERACPAIAPMERRGVRALRSFTLVELLVVISIIAILAGLVMPMFYSAKERAREAKAKIEVKALETAFKSYLDTYKVWPDDTIFPNGEIKENIFKILRGENFSGKNPQNIPFYEFKNYANFAVMDPVTAYDPWANPDPSILSSERNKHIYQIMFDKDYDNKISIGGQVVNRCVVVWSPGDDGTNDFGGGDDVASWK